ncbi:MAG: alpha/beta fold hydrolase, partial [Actinomycetota bacterium]|nr:alpha/beta fold hydrolase [Actinomycetota bacterium]
MRALELRGVELSCSERGDGPPALFLHRTATDSSAWAPTLAELGEGVRAIAYDRRGWGRSSAPQGYVRTTIEEQSEDAAALLEALDAAPAVLCGAGSGAVIALDLLLRLPELVASALLLEPPILSLLPEATRLLSEDRELLEGAAGSGREALVDLYLSGGLGALSAGVARIPPEL